MRLKKKLYCNGLFGNANYDKGYDSNGWCVGSAGEATTIVALIVRSAVSLGFISSVSVAFLELTSHGGVNL